MRSLTLLAVPSYQCTKVLSKIAGGRLVLEYLLVMYFASLGFSCGSFCGSFCPRHSQPMEFGVGPFFEEVPEDFSLLSWFGWYILCIARMTYITEAWATDVVGNDENIISFPQPPGNIARLCQKIHLNLTICAVITLKILFPL